MLPVATAAATTAPPASTRWVWPVGSVASPPEVVSRFDPPRHRWLAGHRGVDLAVPLGTPVLSAGPGVVGHAGLVAGRGVVTVVHGALRTTYEPVDVGVRRGQAVAAGQALGRLAGTPSHCAPRACLHWGLLRGETYLDPLALVAPGPPRLLPLGADALSPPPGELRGEAEPERRTSSAALPRGTAWFDPERPDPETAAGTAPAPAPRPWGSLAAATIGAGALATLAVLRRR